MEISRENYIYIFRPDQALLGVFASRRLCFLHAQKLFYRCYSFEFSFPEMFALTAVRSVNTVWKCNMVK